MKENKEVKYMSKELISKFFRVPKDAIIEAKCETFKYVNDTHLPKFSFKKLST